MKFTLTELLNAGSHKWQESEIDIVVKRNLEDLILKVNRLGYQPPMRASSCLRSIKDQMRINPKAMGSSHCFDTNTEILTHNGWKKYTDISIGDSIFSFNMNTGKIEDDAIKTVIINKYTGNMVNIKNTHIDICVTDLHDLVLKKDNQQYTRKQESKKGTKISNSAYLQEKKKPYKKLHAIDLMGKRKNIVVSALKNKPKTEPSVLDLLVCAFICDGYYISSGSIGFNFIKQRKIDRIKTLLNDLGVSYKIHPIHRKNNNGENITIYSKDLVAQIKNLCGKEKNIPQEWILRDSNNIEKLLKELVFFDGHTDERAGCNAFLFTTTNIKNKDTISAMGCLCGYRTMFNILKHTQDNKKWKTAYNIYFTPSQQVRHDTTITNNIEYVEKVENKIVWCIQSNNTTLIVRRNGKIFISGNCFGCAVDIADPDGKLKAWLKAHPEKLVECGLWAEDYEKTKSWCHLQTYSPKSGNRVFLP